VDDQTTAVSSDNQVFDEVFRRDHLDNIVQAQGRFLVPKLIFDLETKLHFVALVDSKRAADVLLGANGDDLIVIGVVMRDKQCRLVRVGPINTVLTDPAEVIQVEVL